MYSVVLLAALSTGTELPDCFGRCGCYGGGYGGCYGGYGGCYGGWGGCYGGYGGGYGVYGHHKKAKKTDSDEGERITGDEGASLSSKARIIVHLPADAQLTVNGQRSKAKQAMRTFVLSSTQPGHIFSVRLKARMERDGHMMTSSRVVRVKAGERSEVTFDAPDKALAQR